jgi:hypothetical protein
MKLTRREIFALAAAAFAPKPKVEGLGHIIHVRKPVRYHFQDGTDTMYINPAAMMDITPPILIWKDREQQNMGWPS